MLLECFVLNIYTKWMLLTKQRVYWLIIKKQIEKKNWLFFLKRASSNLLVDKIKSIVAFKMSELVMISKDGFPYNNVWVKEESVISNNLQSMFLIVLRREDRSLLYMGQWSKKCVVDPLTFSSNFGEFSI